MTDYQFVKKHFGHDEKLKRHRNNADRVKTCLRKEIGLTGCTYMLIIGHKDIIKGYS